MKLKLFTFMCALLVLMSGTVFGAVTGKITGVVTDADNQQPLIGTTVSVQGTSWGAITDDEGRYTILNVPVGTYTLVFSAVGYGSVEVSNIAVHADLATYYSQALSTEAAELGTVISVTAERSLIMKDKTTTINIVEKEELQALPTRGFDQIVGIQNSVVRKNSSSATKNVRGGREATGTGSELNLRGGRPGEVAYYVDGFSQQDPLTGISTANIANNAIQEVSIQAGAFSAEYGHVSSGVVNVITNSGSDAYHGTLELITDNVVSDSYDHNWYAGDVGGPIPGVENGTFFFSGERRYQRDRTPSSKTEEMLTEYGKPFGFDTLYSDNPQRLPDNALSGWSYQGKIDYNFTPNFKLQLTGNGSIDNWQEYRQEWLFNSEHAPRYEDKNLGFNAKITHTLNSKTFYNLSASYFTTERYRGDGVVFKDLEGYRRDLDGDGDFDANPEFDAGQLFWVADAEYFVGDPLDSIIVYQDALYSGYLHRESSYWGAKGDITNQLSASSTIKFGFDFQRHTLRKFRVYDATKEIVVASVNNFGYDSVGNEYDGDDWWQKAKTPMNFGAYVQERFEWQGLIVNAGLRFDYFDYQALRIINPERPFDPDGILLDTLGTPEQDSLAQILDRDDLEDSEKFYRVSPRLGISFPISEKTQMHINYGKFYQRPNLNNLFVNYRFFEARVDAGSYLPFPSPNLGPEKTTQYEFGATHLLGDNASVSFTAYYKDVNDLAQIFHQSPAEPTEYDFFDNTDFGTIKGVDLAFKMRRTKSISLDLKYTLSWATGTGSYETTQYIIAWQNPTGTPRQTNPLDYDQRHSILAVIDYRNGENMGPKIGDIYPLENFGINVLVNAASGTAYTPMGTYNELFQGGLVSTLPEGGINSGRLPWTLTIDFKAEKKFIVSGLNITPYLWVKNLLDRDNVTNVYESSGQADYIGWLESDAGQDFAATSTGTERWQLAENNPSNYSNPRQILVGLRMNF